MEKGSVFDLFAAAAARNPQGAFLCVLPETAAAYGIEPGEISYAQALERTGSYGPVLWVLISLLAIAAVLLSRFRPFPPAQMSST